MKTELVKAPKVNGLVITGGPILPAIIADAGREGSQTLHRVLHRHHPQRQHPRRPMAGPWRISSPGATAPPDPHRHRAGARRRLHRELDQGEIRPDRQAAPRRHPHVLRLADQRRHHRLQPGQLGTRPQARRQAGQNARAHRRRSQGPARQHHPRKKKKPDGSDAATTTRRSNRSPPSPSYATGP